MQITEKAFQLLSQKFYSRIVIVGDYKKNKHVGLLDKENDTLFTVSNNFLYSFKDKYGNVWLTIPKSLVINEREYSPTVGDTVTYEGIEYSFTTKEAVVELATKYFENFIDPDFGILMVMQVMYFFENKKNKKVKHPVAFKKFKYKIHDKIEAFTFCN